MPTHIDERIEAVLDEAMEAFFEVLAKSFPEVKSGDFSPGDTFAFWDASRQAARAWVYGNIPSAEAAEPL